MRTALTVMKPLIVIAIIAVLLACLIEIPPPAEAGIRLMIHFIFGWLLFLWRLPSEVSIDAENTIIAVACFGLLAAGAHGVCRLLSKRGSAGAAWSWRWTAAGLGIVLLAAGAGISAVAVTHQSIWLTKVDEPWVKINRTQRVGGVPETRW